MRHLSTAALIVTLMTGVSGIALAADTAATSAPKPAAAQATAPVTPAAPSTVTAAKPTMHHAAMMRHPRRDRSDDRGTKALNLLEASGYAQIEQFRPDGKNFDATVKQGGKEVQVTVDPDSGQISRHV